MMVELTPDLFSNAMSAARTHRLRAYDAVQLAVAPEVRQIHRETGRGQVTRVSADRDLNAAAIAEGFAVEDPTTHP
jgi:hypothetical protein